MVCSWISSISYRFRDKLVYDTVFCECWTQLWYMLDPFCLVLLFQDLNIPSKYVKFQNLGPHRLVVKSELP
jgi:hypothetical protein